MLGLSTHANKELKFENDTLRNMELTLNTEILKNISPGCVNETQVNKSLSTQNETQKICKPSLETVSLQSHEQLADPPRNQDPTVMVSTQEILNSTEDTVTTEAQKLTVESHIQVENETHWLLEPTSCKAIKCATTKPSNTNGIAITWKAKKRFNVASETT